MFVLFLFLLFILLALLAPRWGVDSRDAIDSPEWTRRANCRRGTIQENWKYLP